MPKVEIYSKDWCSYCQAAKRLLTQLGYEFTEIDVTHDVEKYKEMRERAPRQQTVPQIFFDGSNIGGYTDLVKLMQTKQLPPPVSLPVQR
jgi:GrxC family glutaredoxin